eukprot:GSChrysophyteH2.ASY1.ANO1.852.1 assembled CDS
MIPVNIGSLTLKDRAVALAARKEQGDPSTEGDVFIALARVFSGTLEGGAALYVLNHRYSPEAAAAAAHANNGTLPADFPNVKKVNMNELGLYMCLGPSIASVEKVPAGNIVGIFGLNQHVLKTATLCSTWKCQPLRPMTFQAQPMVQVAVEPATHQDLQRLETGLQALHQYDPVVEIEIDSVGQYMLSCLGELHLEHCLKMLEERFAKCKLSASEPLVSIRETVIETFLATTTDEAEQDTRAGGDTSNWHLSVTFRAVSVPVAASEATEEHSSNVWAFAQAISSPLNYAGTGTETNKKENPNKSTDSTTDDCTTTSTEALNRILAVGPPNTNTNLLMLSPDTFLNLFSRIRNGLTAGFQLAAAAGPLMKEPLYGVAFLVENVGMSLQAVQTNTSVGSAQFALFGSGHLISQVADSLHLCMLSCPLRLVEPFYECSLQCESTQLGALYSVLSKRRGTVIDEDIIDGTSVFLLKAWLPVIESFGFAQELLKKSSGEATTPQMTFSHWYVQKMDPFWRPTSEEELDVYGNDSAFEAINAARTFIDKTRKRKGLQIEEKVVENAEKQRTLKR